LIIRDAGYDGVVIEPGTSGAGEDIYVVNCFVWNCYRDGIFINTIGGVTSYVYNCTVEGCNTSSTADHANINCRYGNGILINNISLNGGGEGDYTDSAGSGEFLSGSKNNVSSDATAPGGSDITSVTATDYVRNTSTEDLRLTDDSDNLAIQTGYDLYLGSDNYSFNTSINDTTRESGYWDRGAHQSDFNGKFGYWFVSADTSAFWASRDTARITKTIAAAIDSSTTFDVICVAEGVYNENELTPKSNTTLYGGFDRDDSTLSGRGSFWQFKKRTKVDGDSAGVIFLVDDNSSITLDGFYCWAGSADNDYGGAVAVTYSGTDVTVRNFWVEKCEAGRAKTQGWGCGIIVDTDTDGLVLVENMVVIDSYAYCGAIESTDGSHARFIVRNCLVYNSDAFGFEVSWHEGTPVYRTDHEFVNCVGWESPSSHRGSSDQTVFWSWARDFATYSYCDHSAWSDETGDGKWGPPDATIIFETTEPDPMFRDADNHDFRLRRGSPLVGAGENGTDIGPFELERESISY